MSCRVRFDWFSDTMRLVGQNTHEPAAAFVRLRHAEGCLGSAAGCEASISITSELTAKLAAPSVRLLLLPAVTLMC